MVIDVQIHIDVDIDMYVLYGGCGGGAGVVGVVQYVLCCMSHCNVDVVPCRYVQGVGNRSSLVLVGGYGGG